MYTAPLWPGCALRCTETHAPVLSRYCLQLMQTGLCHLLFPTELKINGYHMSGNGIEQSVSDVEGDACSKGWESERMSWVPPDLPSQCTWGLGATQSPHSHQPR